MNCTRVELYKLYTGSDCNHFFLFLWTVHGCVPMGVAVDENGSISLGPGRDSGLILRLAHPAGGMTNSLNCSVKVKAGKGLAGLSLAIEEMNLRERTEAGGPARSGSRYIFF